MTAIGKMIKVRALRWLLLALGLGVFSTGCSVSRRHPALAEAPVPLEGGQIDPAIWKVRVPDAPDNDDEDAVKAANDARRMLLGMFDRMVNNGGAVDYRYWFFPFQFDGSGFQLNKEGETGSTIQMTWNDLGSQNVRLPLSVHYRKIAYDKNSIEPVGEQEITWNPFWTTAHATGQPRMDAVAYGVPLLWSMVQTRDDDSEHSELFASNTLWTLGPMLVSGNGREKATSTRFTAFAPLALAGPGALLWSDYAVDSAREGVVATGHGPLLGVLGYFDLRRNPPAAKDLERAGEVTRLRTILGGLAWADLEHAGVRHATHGVLRGGFGWGERNGVPTVQLFWVPIPAGR